MTCGSRFRRKEHGEAQVEFAFSIFTVLIVVFLMIEFCSAIYTYVVLSEAANEGVRYAIVHAAALPDDIKNVVKTYASYSLHDVSGMQVTTGCPPSSPVCGNGIPRPFSITVSYPYIPYLSLVMQDPPTMHAYAEGVIIY